MSVPTRIRLGSAVMVVLALAACGSSKSPAPAASPTAAPSSPSASTSASPSASSDQDFFESFDNNDNDWPTRSDPDGTKLGISGGEYRITLPAGSIRYIRPAALAQRADVRRSVSVAAKVNAVSGKTYAYGLACRMSPSDKQYYIGRLFENGTSAIVRREKAQGERILKGSRANPISLPPGKQVQLVFLCGEKNGKMELGLTVNGQVAVQVEDPNPLPENPPGIYAVAGLNSRDSSFAFDDILVSQYTP